MASSNKGDDIIISSALLIASTLYQRRQVLDRQVGQLAMSDKVVR